MLRITPSVSAAAAKSYFREALSTGDYYLPALRLPEGPTHPRTELHQEIVGTWLGKGAARLGLEGVVEREAFDRLCDNLHPVSGNKLTPRTKDARRVFYDLTFSVPKSVSIVSELCGDGRIVAAFREAVAETLAEMEASMKTRVRRKGENADRVTGNMAVAEFVHLTSRPVDGVPDPHLHLHAVAFNCTWDETEERWKAGEFGDLKRDAPYHQAACDARMAAKLRGLGYEIRQKSGDGNREVATGWEIAGVPESLIKKFSRRTEEIERLAAALNVTDPDRKGRLGAKTRGRKHASLSMATLREEWGRRVTAKERAALAAVSEPPERIPGPEWDGEDRSRHAERAVAFAIAHAFERASVVSEKRLLAAALQHGVGLATVDDVKARMETLIAGKEALRATLDGEVMLTTPGVHAEEQAMLATVKKGRGEHAPLKPGHEVSDPELSAEQREAVRHVLESTDSVILLRGRAGVGKTRAMREIVTALGTKAVQVSAPTGMATHEVLRAEGFRNAETAAKVLASRLLQQKLEGKVLWVDEAGLLSVPDLAKLVKLASERKCRLLLTGDTAQHRAVARGDALRLLETESGIVAAHLTKVRRQRRADYRSAVETLAKGDLVGAFERFDAMGVIKEASDNKRPRLVAEAYLDSIQKQESVLVVAPTHAEGRKATEAIREKLKAEGLLAREEVTVERLHNRQLTEAERGEARSHRIGDVVQFHRNAPALVPAPPVGGPLPKSVLRAACFRPGDRARIVGVTETEVTVHRARDDRLLKLPLQAPNAFQSFETRTVEIAVGDRIRITYTGRDVSLRHLLSNGALYAVKSIDAEGRITLENGWRLPRNFGHLTHGYAVTSDASQGRTVDHVIDLQSDISEAASNLEQFYTTVTRGRHRLTIVTDSRDRLLKSVARDNSRMTATEFLKLAREQLMPPTERGMNERKQLGAWMSREHSRRLRAEANRDIERRTRERSREQSRTQGRGRESGKGVSRGR